MDYRNRKYYLVTFDGHAFDFRLHILKREISKIRNLGIHFKILEKITEN